MEGSLWFYRFRCDLYGKEYFYELVDRLVKWMNNYEYCPFDIYGIYISKDYEGSANYSKHIHIKAGLSDSEVDINKFLKHSFSNRHTNDSKFQHEVLDWFKIGKYGGFLHMEFIKI